MSAPTEHPAWCDTSTCGVTGHAGGPIGAHRSRPVVFPGSATVSLSLWQIIGQDVAVSLDFNMPVQTVLFDVVEAAQVAAVLADLRPGPAGPSAAAHRRSLARPGGTQEACTALSLSARPRQEGGTGFLRCWARCS